MLLHVTEEVQVLSSDNLYTIAVFVNDADLEDDQRFIRVENWL